jgi:hypothetical protein
MAGPRPRHDTRGKTYVLQEGRYDDIAAVEVPIERIDSGDPRLVGVEFPCVVAAADPGTVRPWCEAKGIKLTPHLFYGKQVDYIIQLDTAQKRARFERKWLG